MKVDSVITLEDEINCLLLDKAVYENDNYFLAVVLDENDEPTDDCAVLKEIVEDNNTYVIREDDEKILAELVKMFTKTFNTLVSELPDEID